MLAYLLLTLTTEKKWAPNSRTAQEGQTPPPREFCNAGLVFPPVPACSRLLLPAPLVSFHLPSLCAEFYHFLQNHRLTYCYAHWDCSLVRLWRSSLE